MSGKRDLDVVVFGATGFVGRRVVRHLAKQAGGPLRWALAGRSMPELEALKEESGLSEAVQCLRADAGDMNSIMRLAERANVVLSVVGPYQRFGSPLVAACVATGAGYVDLNGEPLWMREMIDAHESAARSSGARVVFSCGYDSIPFEFGVARVQALCLRRWGRPAARVSARVLEVKGGGYSTGTVDSLRANQAASSGDPRSQERLHDPFLLTPGFQGAIQIDDAGAFEDPSIGRWVAPHIMATINAKNVHRSNMLRGFPYGKSFRYDEMIAVNGTGAKAKAAAEAMVASDPLETAPRMNERREQPEDGRYRLLFLADGDEHGKLALTVEGDADPGYGSTSKMIAQTAICLACDNAWRAGVWTPGALMGDALLSRLETHAGLMFKEVDPVALSERTASSK